jgi:hypothetical protein
VNIKIEDMYRSEDLSNSLSKKEKKIYEDIHNKLIESGYICKKGRYHNKGKGKEMVIIGFSEDRGFTIRMRLPKLSNYSLNLDILSERVRECILNGKNCCFYSCCFAKNKNLETCGQEYTFRFQDKSYLKCKLVYENFIFYGLSEEDTSSLKKLIDNEVSYLMKPHHSPNKK